MRYKPEEKIQSLIVKIQNHLADIEIVMKKLFPAGKTETIKSKKSKSKK